jgi:hypothetical protein
MAFRAQKLPGCFLNPPGALFSGCFLQVRGYFPVPLQWRHPTSPCCLTQACSALLYVPYAMRSMSNRDPGSPQGTLTCLTLCSRQDIRGTSASSIVVKPQVSKCRQRRFW